MAAAELPDVLLMSSPLAIVWDRPNVVAFAGGDVRDLAVADELTDAEAMNAVCDALDGVAADELIGVVPRDRAAWRTVDVPLMPDAELPDVARLQFATRLSGAADAYAVDFVAVPSEDGLRLSVVGVPTATVTIFAAIAQRLSLTLAAVRLSSGCLADAAPQDAAAAIAVGPASVETVFFADGPDGRSVAGANARRHDRGVGGLGEIIAVERRRLALTIGDEANVAVIGDPSDTPASIAARAAAGPSSVAQWDFANPRRSAPPRDVRRTAIAAIALLLAASFLSVVFVVRSKVSELDDETAVIREKIAASEDYLKAKGGLRSEAADVAAWSDARPDPAAVMGDLIAVLPDRRRLIFATFDLSATGRDARTMIRSTVFAVDRRDLERLAEDLERRGYSVQTSAISASDERPGYAWKRLLSFTVAEPGGSDADA